MKYLKYTLLFLALGFSSQSIFAGKDKEREYLIQVLNQLEAVKPTIILAAKEQPKNNRFHFHYFAYQNSDGIKQNGLLEDINEIEQGIKARLNTLPTEPHMFKQLSGDYIDGRNSNHG